MNKIKVAEYTIKGQISGMTAMNHVISSRGIRQRID